MDPRDAMPKAKRAAETAVRLDESIADAHATLGYVRLVYDWDGPGAAKALVRALDLNPTLATARLNYAAYLTTQARDDDAVREVRRAVDLDPLSVRTHAFGTVLLLFTRRYDEAIDLARRGLEFEPDAAFTWRFREWRTLSRVGSTRRSRMFSERRSWTTASPSWHCRRTCLPWRGERKKRDS